MNFNQLKIFYTVANKKSFSLAGKGLYLTQPDISIQVHHLEEYFGVPLIERAGKNIELTDPGIVLFSYAKRIFELSLEAESVIGDYKTLSQGTLKIHTTGTIAKCYLPEILGHFKKSYPNIKIILRAGNSQEAVDSAANFEADIAIPGRIHYDNKLSFTPFITDHLVLVASPKNDLCKRKKIDLKDLVGKPIIIREPGSGLRKFTLEIFEKEGISPNIVMELTHCDAIKKLVEHGVGLSFMTYTMVMDELKRGILKKVNLLNKDSNMQFDIVYHKSREASQMVKAFIQTALNTIPDLKKISPTLTATSSTDYSTRDGMSSKVSKP